MFNIGDYLVYGREVCKVIDIKNNHFNGIDYYILAPISDESLKIDVPVNNVNGFRNLICKKQIDEIINNISKIDIIRSDEKILENEYKNLISTGKHENLIKIIKTTYLRNKEKKENKKKISEKDDKYFKLAECYLYNEFSIVLNMNYEDTKKYVVDKVTKIDNCWWSKI